MRAVVQRVSEASVSINQEEISSIKKGLLVLVGIEEADTSDDIVWLSGKIARLRIFPDDNNVMNLSLIETDGEILAVSQFTLHASTKKGNRPSYIRSAKPEMAIPVYEQFVNQLKADTGKEIKMQVALINDGPVTIIIDTKHKE